jgi:deoxyribose-phosphate aldolase
LAAVDHTLLSPTATWQEIKEVCDEGILYETATVCIPPSFVESAVKYVNGRIPICTVAGFPYGYSSTMSKVNEAAEAVKNGAKEIDMVINIGRLKDKSYDYILEEIKAVKRACQGKYLKVIIETCLLDMEEKIKMCEIVSDSGADFIKTSTGFFSDGATQEDVKLMINHVRPGVKVKAAGGISTLEDAAKFLQLGAARLGSSRLVKLVKSIY